MFGKLFKGNSSTIVAIDPEPNRQVTTNLATLLILTMTAELAQAEHVTGQLVPVINDVRESYNRLLRLGMGSTQNALALRDRINENEQASMNKSRAMDLIKFVKAAQSHFGPKTILISYTAFDELCKKYNLATGALENYCGVIPVENIADIDAVMVKMSTFSHIESINVRPNDDMSKGYMLRVDSMDIRSDDEQIEKFVNKYDGLIMVKQRAPHFDGAWWPEDCIDAKQYTDYKWSNLTKIYGKVVDSRTMFIACPQKYLKNPEIKISKILVDPAVFQYTPYGILIHTIWGEEAEDVAFKKFMELNTRISQL